MQFVYTSPRDLIRTQTRTRYMHEKYNSTMYIANWLTVNCCSDIPIFLFCYSRHSLCPECAYHYYDYFVAPKLLQFCTTISLLFSQSLSRRCCWILHFFDASLRFHQVVYYYFFSRWYAVCHCYLLFNLLLSSNARTHIHKTGLIKYVISILPFSLFSFSIAFYRYTSLFLLCVYTMLHYIYCRKLNVAKMYDDVNAM